MFDDLIMQLEFAILSMIGQNPKRLASAAKQLSLLFTSERSALPSQYFSDADFLDAYIAAFLLPNAVKVMHCLVQMENAGLIPEGDSLNVLDVGCGPATATLAASSFFSKRHPERRIRFAGVEQNKAALLKAHDLFKKIAPPQHSFESITFSIKDESLRRVLKAQRFDVLLAANLLSELSGISFSYDLCCELISDWLSERGALIIIEPALHNTARRLMWLRDRLLADGVAKAWAPCLHRAACPMLCANERDWCHFYIGWECPEYLAELDRHSGMNHDYLKMAYLILKPARSFDRRTQDAFLWRVVSSPLDSKGKRELLLCGACSELKRIRRLNKDSSDANQDFNIVRRGDIVRYAGNDRMHKDDAFSIINKWPSPLTLLS